MSLTHPIRSYSGTPVAARCPACHHEAARHLYGTDAREAAQHFVLAEREPERHHALRDHIEALWGGPTCAVVECERCRFGYSQPEVAGDARFYELAFQRRDGAYPSWKWEYDQTLAALDLRQSEDGDAPFRYLELGAGDGAFLKAVAPARTPRDNALCTELSPYAADAIEAYGVACARADLRTLDPATVGRFDVVATFQMLQHLVGLDDVFEALNALTTPGAHLFVSVPNVDRIELHELHGAMMDLPPGHVGRWRRAPLEALAERHGWSVREYTTEPTEPLALLKEVATYRHLRRGQIPGSPTNRIEAVRSRRVRQLLRVPAVALRAAAALPLLARLGRRAPGPTDWAWLQRSA